MKRVSLILFLSSMILAAFAHLSDKRRATFTGYYYDSGGLCQRTRLSAPLFTLTGVIQAQIQTAGGAWRAIFSGRINTTLCNTTALKFKR